MYNNPNINRIKLFNKIRKNNNYLTKYVNNSSNKQIKISYIKYCKFNKYYNNNDNNK